MLLCRINKYYSEYSAGISSLFVDTTSLDTFGKFLVESKNSLDTHLTSMDTTMAGLSVGWDDANGKRFYEKFSQLVKEAKKVKDDIGALGDFAKSEASKYNNITTNAVNIIKGDTTNE